MNTKLVWIVIGLLPAFLFVGRDAFPADPRIEESQVFKVPTSGEIIDVEYAPTFDEWWVKCREKNGIAVYVYDKSSKKWSNVVFVAAPEIKEPKPASAKRDPQPTEPEEKFKPEAESKPESEPAPEPVEKPEPPQTVEKSTDKDKKRSEESKERWWNPLKIIKKKLESDRTEKTEPAEQSDKKTKQEAPKAGSESEPAQE